MADTHDMGPERLEFPMDVDCPRGHSMLSSKHRVTENAVWDQHGRLYCASCLDGHRELVEATRKANDRSHERCDEGHPIHEMNTHVVWDAEHKRPTVKCLDCDQKAQRDKKVQKALNAPPHEMRPPRHLRVVNPESSADVTPIKLTDEHPHAHLFGNEPQAPMPELQEGNLYQPRQFWNPAPFGESMSNDHERMVSGLKVRVNEMEGHPNQGNVLGLQNEFSPDMKADHPEIRNLIPVNRVSGGTHRGHVNTMKERGIPEGEPSNAMSFLRKLQSLGGIDPITGKPFYQGQKLQIDHIFPTSGVGTNWNWNKQATGEIGNMHIKNDYYPTREELVKWKQDHLLAYHAVVNPTNARFSASRSFGIPKLDANGDRILYKERKGRKSKGDYQGFRDFKDTQGNLVPHYRIPGFNQYVDKEFDDNGVRHPALTRWLDALDVRDENGKLAKGAVGLPKSFNREKDHIFREGEAIPEHPGYRTMHLNDEIRQHFVRRVRARAPKEFRDSMGEHIGLLRSGPFPVTLRKASHDDPKEPYATPDSGPERQGRAGIHTTVRDDSSMQRVSHANYGCGLRRNGNSDQQGRIRVRRIT